MNDLAALPTFVNDGSIHVVVETPRGSSAKLKYDPHLRVMTLSRPLTLGLTYPYDWGFVPSTRGPDGDPLDAMVMWDGRSYPGVVLPCKPLGLLCVEQENRESHRRERNDRLVMLPVPAPRSDAIRTVFDLAERVRVELEQFFLTAVAFEGKHLTMRGWAGPDDAISLIRASLATGQANAPIPR